MDEKQKRYEEIRKEIFQVVKSQEPVSVSRLGPLLDTVEKEFGFLYARVTHEMLDDGYLFYTEDRLLKTSSRNPL